MSAWTLGGLAAMGIACLLLALFLATHFLEWQRQYRLRFTMGSGRRMTLWVKNYNIRTGDTGLDGYSIQSVGPTRLLAARARDIAAIELIDTRTRLVRRVA